MLAFLQPCKARARAPTVQIAALWVAALQQLFVVNSQRIGSMRHFCLVAAWVAALQHLCVTALHQQQRRATPAASVDHSRRQFAQAAASALVATALPRAASAVNETQPEFDAAAYFGIFSCEGWGQKRMPGSNTCMPK